MKHHSLIKKHYTTIITDNTRIKLTFSNSHDYNFTNLIRKKYFIEVIHECTIKVIVQNIYFILMKLYNLSLF